MSDPRPDPADDVVGALSGALKGRVIGPADADYDAARTVFYGGIDRRPAAIARVAGAEDVARAIRVARDRGMDIAVRSGGHSPAGHGLNQRGS